MKRARSTAAPRPHRRASHRAGPIRCRTRPVDRTKRPSGPGTLGHHSPVVSVGPSYQTRRRDTRGRAALLPHLLATGDGFGFFRRAVPQVVHVGVAPLGHRRPPSIDGGGGRLPACRLARPPRLNVALRVFARSAGAAAALNAASSGSHRAPVRTRGGRRGCHCYAT